MCFVSTNLFFATGHGSRLLLLLRQIGEQQHPAAAACTGTSMPTPKRMRTSLQLQHPAAAPADKLQSAQATLSSTVQQRAAAPYTSTFAAPSSITLAPHHQQASSTAPSSSTVHWYPDSSTLKHHHQAAPAATLCSGTSMPTPNTLHQRMPLQTAHTTLKAARKAPTAYRLQSAQNTLTAALLQQVETGSARCADGQFNMSESYPEFYPRIIPQLKPHQRASLF